MALDLGDLNTLLPMAWRCSCGYFSDEMDRTVCKGCHGPVNPRTVTQYLLLALNKPSGDTAEDDEEY